MIAPCPFCAGRAEVAFLVTYRVRCSVCDAMGPPGVTRQIAVDGWNARA